MGVLGCSLLAFFIWFINIVKGSSLEITCYLGIALSIILMLLAVYTYYYKKPVLSFNDTGLIYYSLKPPLKFEWQNIKNIEYSLKPWRDVPSTITVKIILKNNAMTTIGLCKSLSHGGKPINSKQAFELLKIFLNGN